MYSLTFIEYIIYSLALSSNNLKGKTIFTLRVKVSILLDNDEEVIRIALVKVFLYYYLIISYIKTTSIVIRSSSSISTKRSN